MYIFWHITGSTPDDCPINSTASSEKLRSLHLFRDKVHKPIRAFTGPNNDEERNYLFGVLLEKIIVTIWTPSSNAYNAKLLYARRG